MREVRAHRPDVAVVDIRMPPTHTDEGLRAARAIREELPGTGVLVLSQYVEDGRTRSSCWGRARRASATCSRTASPTATRSPTPCARSGRAARRSTRRSSRGCSTAAAPEGPLDKLSPREREVLGRMAEGQSNQAIAESLGAQRARRGAPRVEHLRQARAARRAPRGTAACWPC